MCCPERQGRSDQTHASHMRNWEESLVDPWVDSSQGSKRQSLLDLTAGKAIYSDPRKVGTETAVVNASIMAKSYNRGPKAFNKAIVVDILVSESASGEVLRSITAIRHL